MQRDVHMPGCGSRSAPLPAPSPCSFSLFSFTLSFSISFSADGSDVHIGTRMFHLPPLFASFCSGATITNMYFLLVLPQFGWTEIISCFGRTNPDGPRLGSAHCPLVPPFPVPLPTHTTCPRQTELDKACRSNPGWS